jgi:hypothetical protein
MAFDIEKYNDPIIIDDVSILPGEEKVVKISVGRLPSDNRIFVYAHVFRSLNPGPIILIQGGVHGDEINGVEIVRRSLEDEYFKNLKCGTVIAIPILNIYGFINFSRHVPDGKDVNRSFPGTLVGSLASRTARIITKKILPYTSIALDFHTGGSSRYNYPQIRYGKTDKQASDLAEIFGAPFRVQKPYILKSFRKVARDEGVPVIVFEGGESERFDGFSISHGLNGMKRVLNSFGMTDFKVMASNYSKIIPRSSWVRASQAGMFLWSKSSGARVIKGEPIGVIKDPFGTRSVTVLSKLNGYIIGHNNASVVNEGDALFHIGLEK